MKTVYVSKSAPKLMGCDVKTAIERKARAAGYTVDEVIRIRPAKTLTGTVALCRVRRA